MKPPKHINDNQPHTENQAKHHQKHREKWVKCPLFHGVRKYRIRRSVKWEIAIDASPLPVSFYVHKL